MSEADMTQASDDHLSRPAKCDEKRSEVANAESMTRSHVNGRNIQLATPYISKHHISKLYKNPKEKTI